MIIRKYANHFQNMGKFFHSSIADNLRHSYLVLCQSIVQIQKKNNLSTPN